LEIAFLDRLLARWRERIEERGAGRIEERENGDGKLHNWEWRNDAT